MSCQASAPQRSEDDPAFDAFRRHDQYGLEGSRRQSVLEYLRLAVMALTILPIKIVTDNRPHQNIKSGKVAGIVSNHCSWADILVHMSRSFPSFVARYSTKNLVWVGLIRYSRLLAKPVFSHFHGLNQLRYCVQSAHGLSVRGA